MKSESTLIDDRIWTEISIQSRRFDLRTLIALAYSPASIFIVFQVERVTTSRSQMFLSNQANTRENIFHFFLPRKEFEPRNFQSWVYWPATWAITPFPGYVPVNVICIVKTYIFVRNSNASSLRFFSLLYRCKKIVFTWMTWLISRVTLLQVFISVISKSLL